MTGETPRYEPEPVVRTAPPINVPRVGALKRLALAFTSPNEVFADILRRPTWVLCLVVLVAIGVGSQLIVQPHLDLEATIRARMAESGREISDEQMDRITAQSKKFALIGPLSALIAAPLVMFIFGGLYFLGLKIAGSEVTFPPVFSGVLHALWPPGVTKAALSVVLIQRVGKVPAQELEHLVKSNVGAFLSADAPRWLASLGTTLDVFNLWTIALLVIGLSTIGRVSRSRSLAVVGTLWVLYLIVKVGWALARS